MSLGVLVAAVGLSALTLPLACAQSYKFVTFDVPGAASTRANGINNSGQIAGTWTDGANHTHGFLRSADGSTFTPVDPPNAVPDSIRVNGINNLGQVVGSYGEAGTLSASGDRARSAAAYKDLLTLWKDADPDIPAVQEAKAEFAKQQ